MRVVVTRPAAQAAEWVDALRSRGLDAVALPLLDIEPLPDPAPLRAAWSTLAQQDLVMFVSANAVQQFFAAAPGPWPQGVLAGSTGPGTSAALRRLGVPAALLVEPAADAPRFDSEALWQRLAGRDPRDWRGRRALIVRGEDGRDWLADALRGAGAEVGFLAAYRRAAPRWNEAERAQLAAACATPHEHLWLFSSSEAVRHLATLAPRADWSCAIAAASHPRIAATVRAAGFGQVHEITPSPAAVAALVGAFDEGRALERDGPPR
jgi:uroporphyrinogen-III synthase